MNPLEQTMSNNLSSMQKLIDTLIQYGVNYGFQVLGAVIILIIGMIAGNWIAGLLFKGFEKKNLDITLSKFIATCAKITVLTFAVIIALGKFGITIAPFVAALSAMALGASFAIQGPLSNYGAGLSIILSRPFVVGNTITVAGVSGLVHEVKLACTVLTDEDGVKITIPNKEIVGQILHNSSAYKIAEGAVGISYSSDPEQAIQIIQKVLDQFPDVTRQPKPQIGIQQFADSAITIGYRFWIPTAKYFHVFYGVNLAVYRSLGQAGINLPFPQRDVRIISQPSMAAVK